MTPNFEANLEDIVSRDLYFDDEPLGAILYGIPSTGPTSATAFAEARETYRRLAEAESNGDIGEIHRLLEGMLDQPNHQPLWLDTYPLNYIHQFMPQCPWPCLPPEHRLYGRVLDSIFQRAVSRHQSLLLVGAGSMLYRWHEGLDEFDRARFVLFRLLRDAINGHRQRDVAVYLANIGYEYLLENNWAEAIDWFTKGIQEFELVGDSLEVANVRANRLTCRFNLAPPDRWDEMADELADLNLTLTSSHDWRARKTLILLARLAESRGRLWSAVNYARRAVNAVDLATTPTRHHEEDKVYLSQLRSRIDGGTRD